MTSRNIFQFGLPSAIVLHHQNSDFISSDNFLWRRSSWDDFNINTPAAAVHTRLQTAGVTSHAKSPSFCSVMWIYLQLIIDPIQHADACMSDSMWIHSDHRSARNVSRMSIPVLALNRTMAESDQIVTNTQYFRNMLQKDLKVTKLWAMLYETRVQSIYLFCVPVQS